MAQAVSRRPLTAEARVRSRVGPCGFCGGQSGTGTGFSPSTSVFPCQFYSTGAPLEWKGRNNLIIFITGLQNKLRCVRSICCGALKKITSQNIATFTYIFKVTCFLSKMVRFCLKWCNYSRRLWRIQPTETLHCLLYLYICFSDWINFSLSNDIYL
jgi:hypothetical protein